jgi:hypothetical protein
MREFSWIYWKLLAFMSDCGMDFVRRLVIELWVLRKDCGDCVSEWVSEWVSDWGSEGVSEWVSEWRSEWVSEWVREWVSEWVREWVKDFQQGDVWGDVNKDSRGTFDVGLKDCWEWYEDGRYMRRETEDEIKEKGLWVRVALKTESKLTVLLQVNCRCIYNKNVDFWNLTHTTRML